MRGCETARLGISDTCAISYSEGATACVKHSFGKQILSRNCSEEVPLCKQLSVDYGMSRFQLRSDSQRFVAKTVSPGLYFFIPSSPCRALVQNTLSQPNDNTDDEIAGFYFQ